MSNNLTDRQTGFATLDKPWNRYYIVRIIEQSSLFFKNHSVYWARK